MQKAFDQEGYFIVRSLLGAEEMQALGSAIDRDEGIRAHAFDIGDGEGRSSKLSLWSHPGSDVTGMLARCEKVAGTMEKVLGGEVYHYHTKLMMKEARTGGSHVWHQDYGYWYKNGCLFPDMGSVFIAIDKTDKENGCLQVIRGSHKLGRIEHIMVGGQTGADVARIEEAKKVLELVYVELDPGDALFFHANVLHKSDRNDSDRRRWVFIISYNRASNNPFKKHHHPCYTPLHKVPNSAILECKNIDDITGKDFMDPSTDETIKPEKK
ncbi:L-proline trans-4-hydroxylase-like isoform X2 [Patiria miniata]|uniref:Phytanoyl-CoA dioxygenase family protein n=1 Tax=Patiria miniata TaxID=46514 RepID=A0A913Z973_PATMI|nr:L-proline trans-4-hydroxylase-like isoform X2 [Patiria miniata]